MTKETRPNSPARADDSDDAGRKEVMLYAFGNIEGSVANQFFAVLNNFLVVAMHVSPLILGLVLAVKTLWDGVTDPIMAYITDNTRSRWGRRRPYILMGGVLHMVLLLLIVLFMPQGAHFTTNRVMEAQKHVNDGATETRKQWRIAAQTCEQQPSAAPAARDRMLDLMETTLVAAVESRASLLRNLPVLEEDVAAREAAAAEAREALAQWDAGTDAARVGARVERLGRMEAAEERAARARGLVEKGVDGHRRALAAGYAALHALVVGGRLSYGDFASPEHAQRAADRAFAAAGLPGLDLYAAAAPARVFWWQADLKRRRAIARLHQAAHDLVREGSGGETPTPTAAFAQTMAARACAAAGLTAPDIFAIDRPPPPGRPAKASMLANIRDGLSALEAPRNADQRHLMLYVLLAYLLFTTLTTIQSVPYYALGIEMSPSYDGRTRVVTYRAVVDKIAGLIQPWVPVFCFSLLFTTAIRGLFWIAVLACAIGIPSTVLMCWFVRERTHFTPKRKDHPGLFRSMWQVARNPHFLRVFGLYALIPTITGTFMTLGYYLNVYWIMGSPLSGAKLGAYIQLIAWGLGFLSLPVINWGCRRFEKHRVLRFAILWMAIGAALHWWCMNPDHPEYQFFLPFFYSVGIGSVFTVLPTLMADVTDVDELEHGVRREGMFGAVMSFLMKLAGAVTPILAGVVLAMAGFSPDLESEQFPETIHRLRLMYSFVPAILLLSALLLLVRYPLTRAKVAEVKEDLRARAGLNGG